MNQVKNEKKAETRLFMENINARANQAPEGFIEECERQYKDDLFVAAQKVMERAGTHPIVLVAGPSGSGKTSSAQKIEHQLDQWGVESHTISMDNYFFDLDAETVPRDEDGNPDLESPLCIDTELLHQHVVMLAAGMEIQVPIFDFTTQSRSRETIPCALKDGEIVVFEGIHALNPTVVGGMEQYSTSIYVSMQSEIVLPDGTVLSPEHMRVLRRIVRDYTHRNRSAGDTIDAWKSVRRGETKYILPYKKYADISINTMLPYEGCVTAHMALDLMMEDIRRLENNEEAQLLLSVAPLFSKILPDQVPLTSLLKEFINK